MKYLSDEWFAAADARLASTELDVSDRSPVCFSYSIDALPGDHPRSGSTIRYRLSIVPEQGSASIEESDQVGDVAFSLRYSTALAVASGQLSGSRAFLDGDIRVGGDVAVLISRSAELEVLSATLPRPVVSDA